jgi:imidazolonepropionase-like amidohydrolase
MTTESRARAATTRAAMAAGLLAACLAAAAGQEKVHRRPIVIIAGSIVDGSGAPARRNDAIVIQDGRIRMMGLTASKRAPKDARMIDASSMWIVPGFVDSDVHLAQTGGLDARPDLLPADRPYRDILADVQRAPAQYLRAYVCAGITAVLNIGGPPWTFELRNGRADDELSPRIATTGPRISMRAPAALQVPGQDGYWIPGNTGGAALVARLAAMSPDLVAVALDAAPGEETMSPPVVRAVVTEAHGRKLRVIAEVATLPQLQSAADAGVDAVVSRVGEAIPDALVERLARQQIVVVPALAAAEAAGQLTASGAPGRPTLVVDDFESRCAPASTVEQVKALDGRADAVPMRTTGEALAGELANLRKMVSAGVVIAAGSGAGEPRAFHGTSLHRAFALMAQAGMTPLQILDSATRNGARLLGRQVEIGQIKEGMAGDLVLLDADPTTDIRNARRVAMTIRGGAIYER